MMTHHSNDISGTAVAVEVAKMRTEAVAVAVAKMKQWPQYDPNIDQIPMV